MYIFPKYARILEGIFHCAFFVIKLLIRAYLPVLHSGGTAQRSKKLVGVRLHVPVSYMLGNL
jgi:hypothetical protein